MGALELPRKWLAAQVERCSARMGITVEEARARWMGGELYNDSSHNAYIIRAYLDLLDEPEPTNERADNYPNDLRPLRLDNEQPDGGESVECKPAQSVGPGELGG